MRNSRATVAQLATVAQQLRNSRVARELRGVAQLSCEELRPSCGRVAQQLRRSCATVATSFPTKPLAANAYESDRNFAHAFSRSVCRLAAPRGVVKTRQRRPETVAVRSCGRVAEELRTSCGGVAVSCATELRGVAQLSCAPPGATRPQLYPQLHCTAAAIEIRAPRPAGSVAAREEEPGDLV